MLYTVIFYLVLSLFSLGVIYIFKKKSDKELRELGQEEKHID